ncbi:hypothetical protein JYU34_018292 [Plutella xylostella]|uniref:Uncharacterized protein n=1 Tax=Plutella xylostella TaxID=51655 RepID=A0ABQ7Q1N8_PLUXY|nr:hypothetical protein JYU34_018292 [Plutella xylostella]
MLTPLESCTGTRGASPTTPVADSEESVPLARTLPFSFPPVRCTDWPSAALVETIASAHCLKRSAKYKGRPFWLENQSQLSSHREHQPQEASRNLKKPQALSRSLKLLRGKAGQTSGPLQRPPPRHPSQLLGLPRPRGISDSRDPAESATPADTAEPPPQLTSHR